MSSNYSGSCNGGKQPPVSYRRTHILSGAAPLFLNFFPVVAVFLRRHTSMAVGQSANQSPDGPLRDH